MNFIRQRIKCLIMNITLVANIINTSVINKQRVQSQKNVFKQNSPSHHNISRSLATDTVSFSGKTDIINPLWKTFCKEVEQNYKNKTINTVISENFSKKENKLGEGFEKIVFKISKIDDYVGAFLKESKTPENAPFVGIKDPLPKFYFGQPLGGNDKYIIMKRIYGSQHSIDDWWHKFSGVSLYDRMLNQNDAKIFLEKIKKIKDFPMESYIDLAKQVKYLTDNNIKMDGGNPNNLMVDNIHKKFQIIDLLNNVPMYNSIKPKLNSTLDMVNVLVDALFQSEYLKVLSKNDAEELKSATKIVIEKCKIAGDKEHLSNDPKIVEQFYTIGQQFVESAGQPSPNFLEYYRRFQDIYK